MGTNRRYGSPAERDERRRQRDALLTQVGRRRLRNCWVDVASSFDNDGPAPGVETVEWALNRRNNIWYARVVYLQDHTVIDAWFPYMQLTPALP